ncbi:MAG: ABC transporter permease [Ardenticatenaceae bacterium]|nr:ABC transporter permease [Anaerolineales bacterium]MCB8967010.1 ABC transporter permease [Ardenticatenaceae bacterium]MCB8989059.1 ABC transporter permease [Ardenticatenaceae bacterium]
MRKRQQRLFALVRKELTQMLRDRRTLGIIMAIPLIELFIFAYAVEMTVDHIPTAVVDMSQDDESRRLVEALVVSGFFDVDVYLNSEAELIHALDAGQVRAGFVIPPNFAEALQRGTAQVLVLVDGSDSFTVQSGYSAALSVTQAFATDLMLQKIDRLGQDVGGVPIESFTHVLYNPNMDDMVFIVPGLGAMLLQYMTINLTATVVVREREMGTIEQLLITPTRPLELMVGKMVPNILFSFLAMMIVTFTGIFWFDVPFRGNFWLYVWLTLLFIVSGLGMGLLMSTVAQTQKQVQQLSQLVAVLGLLLTGFIYPRPPMPVAIQAVGGLIPLTYFVRIVRGIFTKGVGLEFLWSDVTALLIYSAVIMTLAAVTFRKRLD